MNRFQREPFDDWMDEHAALVDGTWFRGSVAGAGRQNEDGTSRQAAIYDLKPQTELILEPEPDNTYDPNAVKVLAPNGIQIGYLDARLAGETVRRRRKGIISRCFVSNLSGTPGQTRGVVFGLMKYQDPELAPLESK